MVPLAVMVASAALSVSPLNPRYFQDASGRIVYLAGTHGVDINSVEVVPGGWSGYLEFLQSHNQNFIRLWRPTLKLVSRYDGRTYDFPGPYRRSGVPGNTDGGNKFDLSQLDQAYFDKLRAGIAAAGEKNIYVSIMLFGGSVARGGPFDGQNNVNDVDDIDANGNATLQYRLPNGDGNIERINGFEKAYVARVADTVRDLGNVLYEIANENGYPDWQYDLVNFIHRYEAAQGYLRHPVGVTAMYQYNADGSQGALIPNQVLVDSPAEWISPGEYFPAGTDYPVADGAKVVIGDTDHYWPPYPVARDRVVWVWECFARGMNAIVLNDPNDLENDGTWTDPPHYPGELAAQFARAYSQRMNLAAAVPRGELSSTGYALADPGSEYLVYQVPDGRSFTVDLAAGTYQYEWFNPDPASNTVVATGTVTAAGGRTSFTPPFPTVEGAVLYLHQ